MHLVYRNGFQLTRKPLMLLGFTASPVTHISSVSTGVHWCPLVSNCVQWCPLVSTSVQWCPLVSTGVHWCPLVSTSVHWCPLVSHKGGHCGAILRKVSLSPLYLQNWPVTHINGLIIGLSTLSKKEASRTILGGFVMPQILQGPVVLSRDALGHPWLCRLLGGKICRYQN